MFMAVSLLTMDQITTFTHARTTKRNNCSFTTCSLQWHGLSREDQQKYYDMARKAKSLHHQMYPGWTARDNYAINQKKKKKKRDKSVDGGESIDLLDVTSQALLSALLLCLNPLLCCGRCFRSVFSRRVNNSLLYSSSQSLSWYSFFFICNKNDNNNWPNKREREMQERI